MNFHLTRCPGEGSKSLSSIIYTVVFNCSIKKRKEKKKEFLQLFTIIRKSGNSSTSEGCISERKTFPEGSHAEARRVRDRWSKADCKHVTAGRVAGGQSLRQGVGRGGPPWPDSLHKPLELPLTSPAGLSVRSDLGLGDCRSRRSGAQ